MKKIALTAAASLLALSVAGCAVEVPMSAFRLSPPDAGKASQEADQDRPQTVPKDIGHRVVR